MAEFDLHVEGVADPLLIADDRFTDAEAMVKHLHNEANRPKWIRLGDVSIYSQNIIAIQEAST